LEGCHDLTDNKSIETDGKTEKWAANAKGAVDEAVDDLTDDETRHNARKRT
jgi:uncharacterized protein YjbJ (UPF0337 family)